ncbi:hypothetical protein B0H16DRAFT_1304055 [Mycena metata]|uniref:CxC5 like cysteine cluster associated with KDZ domain-containing protein n=1 Tax=Mycena metata TaxID=1033252 RepID=A0AAD7JXK3_9AGAR|nr:hypothetical protein B0H16DRAFT_1304055 [Mycena metata]
MGPSVQQLIWILELFFPPELAVQQAIYALGVIISLFPILRLHVNQLNEARRQNPLTGWMRSVQTLLTRAFHEEANGVEAWKTGIDLSPEYAQYICRDLDRLYTLLGLNDGSDLASFSLRPPRPILCTSRLNCKFCPPGHRNLVPSLRRRPKAKPRRVWLLDASFKWVSADLLVARCQTCQADYYPDMITQKQPGQKRTQILEYDTEFIRVSKHGVWVHRKIAVAQEKALQRFHSGWSNFADWVNDSTDDINVQFTTRQSQRLFMEHFSRRLLVAHGKNDAFSCDAHPPTKSLTEKVRDIIGKNGGNVPGAMSHGCMDCTHVKRYASELDRNTNPGGEAEVVGSESGPADAEQPLPPNLAQNLPRQRQPAPGEPIGYTRLGVMDGKTLKHKKCALDDCLGPLFNYKNGRFCEAHLDQRLLCGIIPCGRPIHSLDALTCDDQSHIDWHKQYEDRFHRLSFPGVQRVIRRQMGATEGGGHPVRGPSLQVQLQALGETPGEKVVHTFEAKTIYCVQTVQWSCGLPIGWGICYRSESTPQVLEFLNNIWQDYPDYRPSFMVYDKACELLRHIVTQNVEDTWLTSTKFIVDAWHYIGHRATDILCRTRCNPAPTDGSQPDLVLTEVDDNGNIHQTRAFNTETAEQLNSWLNGFESQLRQMTDVNFDFFMHVLMMIYGETVEKRVVSKSRELTQEFWDEVNGLGGMEMDVDT